MCTAFDLKTGERIQRYPSIITKDLWSGNSHLVTFAFIRTTVVNLLKHDEGRTSFFHKDRVTLEPFGKVFWIANLYLVFSLDEFLVILPVLTQSLIL